MMTAKLYNTLCFSNFLQGIFWKVYYIMNQSLNRYMCKDILINIYVIN